MADGLDRLDRRILTVLQEDAGLALDALAARVGSSRTPVWNRIKKLRAAGVIRATVAVLDPEPVDRGSCFFVLVRTAEHDDGWLERFQAVVREMPEILEAHRLAGDIDYILKVRVRDARGFDGFYRRLVSKIKIFNVTSLLSMEEMKFTTALPIDPEPVAG